MTQAEHSSSRPRPVVTSQAIIAALTFAVGQAVAFGLVPEATSSKVISAAPIVVGALFAVVAAAHSAAAIFSQRRVTPTSDPQTTVTQPDGSQVLEPLVPLSLAVQAEPNDAGIENPDDDFADLVPTGMISGEPSGPPSGAALDPWLVGSSAGASIS